MHQSRTGSVRSRLAEQETLVSLVRQRKSRAQVWVRQGGMRRQGASNGVLEMQLHYTSLVSFEWRQHRVGVVLKDV